MYRGPTSWCARLSIMSTVLLLQLFTSRTKAVGIDVSGLPAAVSLWSMTASQAMAKHGLRVPMSTEGCM
jgi:hypothetical protein